MQPTGSAGGSDLKDCAYRKVHRKPKKNPRLLPSHNRQRRCARSALKPRARPLHVRKPRMRRQRPMQILRQRLHPHRGLNRPGCRTCLLPSSLHRIRSEARKPLAQATWYRWRTILLPATASEPPVAAPAEEPSPPAAPPAPIKRGEIDHTFALLMIVFAVLGIAGPIIHFVDRRRRRRIIISKEEPPQWARVVTLNTPSPRVHVSLPSDSESQDGRRQYPRHRLIRPSGWRRRCSNSSIGCIHNHVPNRAPQRLRYNAPTPK